MKRAILAVTLATALSTGCGDDASPSENNGANNGAANNGAANNGAANNGAANNGAANNGATNNGATNNGATNNGTDCVDRDADGYFVGCDEYNTQPGPDCDDSDRDNWTSCASCRDADVDDWYVDCDAYQDHQGPDCDDTVLAVNPMAEEIQGNGLDDDCDANTSDECEFEVVPATAPEPGLLSGITAAHNYWRARVGAPPLTWNSTLAASAKAYAEECIWEHDSTRSPDAGFSYVGENLYAHSAQPSSAIILDSVQSWADERFDYEFGAKIGNTGNAVVGHYTQLVWEDSREVGCDYARCQNAQGLSFSATIVVCRYGAGGNYTGQLPYDQTAGTCLDLDNDDVWQGMDGDDTDRDVQ